MRGVAGAVLAMVLALAILHASPWWPARAPGFEAIPWRGDWVARALRGTWPAGSALLVWAGGALALLGLAERLWSRLNR